MDTSPSNIDEFHQNTTNSTISFKMIDWSLIVAILLAAFILILSSFMVWQRWRSRVRAKSNHIDDEKIDATSELLATTERQKQFQSRSPTISVRDNQKRTEALVGPEGAVLKCNGFTVDIPPGALACNENISIATLRAENITLDSKQYFSISNILHCEPTGLKFNKPYTVTVRTRFQPIDPARPIPLSVFTRSKLECPWNKESEAILKADKTIVYTSSHFSDHVAQPNERERLNMKQTCISVGFGRFLKAFVMEITWYLMDGNETYDKIKSTFDQVIIPYETHSIRLDRKLVLTLMPKESKEVIMDRNKVKINPIDLRTQDMLAIPSKFLITKKESTRADKIITFYYSIEEKEEKGNSSIYACKDKGYKRFHFTWQQTNVNPNPPQNAMNVTVPCTTGNLIFGSNGTINRSNSSSQALATKQSISSSNSDQNRILMSGVGYRTRNQHSLQRERSFQSSEQRMHGKPALRYTKSCSSVTSSAYSTMEKNSAIEENDETNSTLSVKDKVRRYEGAGQSRFSFSHSSALSQKYQYNNNNQQAQDLKDDYDPKSDVEPKSDSDEEVYRRTGHSSNFVN